MAKAQHMAQLVLNNATCHSSAVRACQDVREGQRAELHGSGDEHHAARITDDRLAAPEACQVFTSCFTFEDKAGFFLWRLPDDEHGRPPLAIPVWLVNFSLSVVAFGG